MINKLEKKFMIVATLVIVIVLLVILSIINVISIRNNIKHSDEILDKISSDIINNELQLSNNPQPHPFERDVDRIFDVKVNDDGQVTKFSSSNLNASKSSIAQSLVDEVLPLNTQKGFVEEYRFLLIERDDFNQIFFLDYSFEKRSESSFLQGSILVFCLAVLLVIILVLLFLKPVMKPIKETYAKQKRFITDASHEIRTPLAIISTNIQLIEMEGNVSEWTSSIQKQVSRLEELSESLVSLARLDEHDLKVIHEKINLSSVLNDVVMGFEPAILADKKTLDVEIQDHIFVSGHHDNLEKMLSTLMHNALKYTSKNGDIHVKLNTKNNRVHLLIENTSDDLEIKTYDEYFDRFFRAESSRNSQTGGFGIGLSIAKSTIEEHKGTIEALSKDGKIFSLIIQLKEYK